MQRVKANRLLGIGLSVIFVILGILFSWLFYGGPYFRVGLILLITGIIALVVVAIRKKPTLPETPPP